MQNIDRIHIFYSLVLFSFLTCNDYVAFILCTPVFFISIRQISLVKSKNFTPEDMFWFCVMLYFGVVPAQGFSNGMFPVFGPTFGLYYSYLTFAKGMAIILCFLMPFVFVYNKYIQYGHYIFYSKSVEKVYTGYYYVALVVAVPIGFFGYIALAGGYSNISLPRTEREAESVHFLAYFFLAFGSVALMNLLSDALTKKFDIFNLIPLVFGLILLWTCMNIFNAPRFFLVASWLPIILILLKNIITYKSIYLLILTGIFFIMPILSMTTRYGDTSSDQVKEVESYSPFLIKDVDIFETTVHVTEYMANRDYYFGDNMMAIVGFAIPRSFWVEKPILGALMVGGELYEIGTATTPNLSFFVGSDAYMDFGYLGVIFVGLVCGYIFSRARTTPNEISYLYIEKAILIGSMPILLRGPVGAIIGYPLCLLLCARIFSWLRNKNYS